MQYDVWQQPQTLYKILVCRDMANIMVRMNHSDLFSAVTHLAHS